MFAGFGTKSGSDYEEKGTTDSQGTGSKLPAVETLMLCCEFVFESVDLDLQDEQRINLLFRTAESILAEIYPPRRNLDHLRVQLDHTNQLEIQTAYRLILHDIPLYLRQLSIHHDGISKALQDHRRALSELELDNNPCNQKKLEHSRKALTQCIVEDNHAQQAVLNAVKAKLNDYQYDLSGHNSVNMMRDKEPINIMLKPTTFVLLFTTLTFFSIKIKSNHKLSITFSRIYTLLNYFSAIFRVYHKSFKR